MAISQLRQVLSSGIFTTFISAFFAAAYFVLMYYYSVYLAFWATGLTALSLIYISWLAYNSAVIDLPIAEFSADLSNSTLQALLGIVQLKTSGAERNFLRSWSLQLRKLINLQLKQLIYSDLFSAYNDLIVPLGTLLIFVLVVPTVLSGQNSTLSWIIIYISFNSAFSGFNRILTASMTMFISVSGQAYVLWQRARPIMFQNPEPGYSPSAIYYDVQGGISISSLTFTYPGLTKPTLDNISIEIKPGQHVAITGDSGCGKSTLVRLILGFFEAEQGSIHIDNILLQKLAIRYYRKQIGVVMQDSPLPNGSISQIVSGGQDFNDDQIWQALKNANVADEINSMPMKLQTILNQGAFNISGGQRQRIALARALIKNPRILILDEATSALDNDSQTLISNSIENMQITRISIAHRLSTIRNADNIFVLGEGSIISSGKWDDVSPYLVAH
jgi:ATP-binding cassette subfamily B protein